MLLPAPGLCVKWLRGVAGQRGTDWTIAKQLSTQLLV